MAVPIISLIELLFWWYWWLNEVSHRQMPIVELLFQ
jgi:hypothetical protein